MIIQKKSKRFMIKDRELLYLEKCKREVRKEANHSLEHKFTKRGMVSLCERYWQTEEDFHACHVDATS